jgi:hypothetical protein
MELSVVLAEAVLRRCWLLNKALENAPLDEALRLAQAADEFLGVDQANAPALPNGQPSKEWRSGNSTTAQTHRSQSAAPLSTATWLHAGCTSTTDFSADTGDSVEKALAEANDTYKNVPNESFAEEAGDEASDSEPPVATVSGLAVLAGMDDVVRYLRQQDDVVVSAGTGAYLVNGRFQLNSEELLARANKIRQRHGKPQFQRIPSGFIANSGGATGPLQDRT